MATWHISGKHRSVGPISTDVLIQMLRNGSIDENTLVWCEQRGGDWVRLLDVAELSQSSTPPPLPGYAVSDTWAWVIASVPLCGWLIETIIIENAPVDTDGPFTILAYVAAYIVFAGLVELPPKDRTCSGLRLRADELARGLIS